MFSSGRFGIISWIDARAAAIIEEVWSSFNQKVKAKLPQCKISRYVSPVLRLLGLVTVSLSADHCQLLAMGKATRQAQGRGQHRDTRHDLARGAPRSLPNSPITSLSCKIDP